MDLGSIQKCAEYFRDNYLLTFYLVITYNGNSFILVGDKKNFAHLMGIPREVYRSNGYRYAGRLFDDVINNAEISTSVIPRTIATTSKMYKKALHFTNSADIFWHNNGPLTVNFNPALSSTHLNNIDVLLTDISTGYMLGWVSDGYTEVNHDIRIKKYCICSWIDEYGGEPTKKEKYLPDQDIELIRYVFAFDAKSRLLRKREYTYTSEMKASILKCCERNNCNLLLDENNIKYYEDIAASNGIACRINGSCL